MAEVLLSPGVLARENDQSFLTQLPTQAGAAILGPTVKGPVGIPTIVTTYSQYQNKFGAIVESGSNNYTYFTSIAAYNYFQQGGDSLLVTRIVSGSYTEATSSIVTGSAAVTQNIFTLETLTEGADQNSTGGTGTSNSLDNGTKFNLRWEITGPSTSSGTFGLLIRRGDDIITSKNVLETWTNLSLDPNSENYISKQIGDQKLTVREDGGTYFTQLSGSYANMSNYVRVKTVNKKTLNYFDNAGNEKSQYTGSIPIATSGTFGGASGTPFDGLTAAANFGPNQSYAFIKYLSFLRNLIPYFLSALKSKGVIKLLA